VKETDRMTAEHPERCEGCALEIAGGTAACQAIFEELVARDLSDVRFGRMHRLLVDVYSLQHPDRYCASAKSFAAHLTGLCWSMEHEDASRARGNEALRAWLDGDVQLTRPTEPSSRGALTIAHVRSQTEPTAYPRAIDEWARSTWEAYTLLHGQARLWIEQAYRRPARPGPIQRTPIEGELRTTGPGRSGRRTDQPKLRSEESTRAVRRNYDFRAFAFDDLRIHHATPSRSTGIIHRIFTISPPFFPRPVTYPLAASAFIN
jgi:uncharacterized protein DUF5946